MPVTQKEFVRFAPAQKADFYSTVKLRVHEYFTKNHISTFANTEMLVKSVIMLLLYFVPYAIMVTGLTAERTWLFYTCWLIMGLGMIGIGTSVMHDAQHDTYSSRRWINRTIGAILEIIGGYAITWRIQHNILHHRFTNIYGLDDDIESIKFLRFTPRQQLKWYHRYQYLYAWAFYMMMTLFWMTAKDYLQVVKYKHHDLLVTQKISMRQALFRLTVYKLFYYSYIILLPVLYSGFEWYHVAGGFLAMHFFAGLSLSCIFQPAHIVESSEFSAPVTAAEGKSMEAVWAEHEVANTTNFAPKNKVLSWFIGGLNFQVEHHLFTNICHVHYPRIAPIVKEAAKEFGIPYNEQPTFLAALQEHVRMLKILGRA